MEMLREIYTRLTSKFFYFKKQNPILEVLRLHEIHIPYFYGFLFKTCHYEKTSLCLKITEKQLLQSLFCIYVTCRTLLYFCNFLRSVVPYTTVVCQFYFIKTCLVVLMIDNCSLRLRGEIN